MRLRAAVPLLMGAWLAAAVPAAPPTYPPIRPGTVLAFPRDHGAHPDYRSEWWYVTGWLETEKGKPLGFQVTFFRSRPPIDQANPSRFSPRQLLFAHAAISDPVEGRLRHDQRSARAGFGLAEAVVADTAVHIDDWSLGRTPDGTYVARIPARGFSLQLTLRPTTPILLQGEAGCSRKGPEPGQASLYYSQPQLAVTGEIEREGRRETVRGSGWLDHEWSTEILDDEAAGWDWTGINLDDGGALMAFRIRNQAGGSLWAGGTYQDKDGQRQILAPGEISFRPQRLWRSPHTGTQYPVAMRIRVGSLDLNLEPLLDDQELDSRLSTGAVYWEGAVTALQNGRRIGRGYLELTGYHRRLDF